MYCHTLPGKMMTKNAATIQPTIGSLRRVTINAMPSAISTTPDA